VPDSLDRIMDTLDSDGATVVTKEINGDVKEMAKRVNGMFNNGNYDTVVALTDNPFAANIAFNKLDGTNAAICASADDASVAKENDANVIIVKGMEESGIAGILERVMKKPGLSGGRPRHARAVDQPKPQKPVAEELEIEGEGREPAAKPALHLNIFKLRLNQPQKQEVHKDSYMLGPKRSGVMGRIKDGLGIIDENPQTKRKGRGDEKDMA